MVLRLVFIAILLFLGACADLDFNNPTDPRNSSHPKDIDYGSFTDPRDGKSYKSIFIGNQTWMAENLNYDAGGYCVSCSIYGRLYNWGEATKVCPDGWHLPTIEEWMGLLSYASWTELKSEKGWETNEQGIDLYGFFALPGGSGSQYDDEDKTGYYGSWWSNSNANGGEAYFVSTYSYNDLVGSINDFYSVRCVKDQFCGSQVFNIETQVCDNNIVYNLCAGKMYNPAYQQCNNNIVETACGNGWYNENTQFCLNNNTYDLCNGKTYDPATQRCGTNHIVETACGNDWYDATNSNFRCTDKILESKCGTAWYILSTHFCHSDTIYPLCNGYEYDPTTQRCGTGSILEVKCGIEWYNPITSFCVGDAPYELCGGQTYDPATQRCGIGSILEVKCGTAWYNPLVYFCLGNTPYELCKGQIYDPATQRCGEDGILESKCGAVWYNPLTHSCIGNNVYERSSSSSAQSSSSNRSSSSSYSSSSYRSSSSSYNPYGHVNCDGYCIWEGTQCDRIATDPLGEWGGVVRDCEEAIWVCRQFSPSKQVYSDSNCKIPKS